MCVVCACMFMHASTPGWWEDKQVAKGLYCGLPLSLTPPALTHTRWDWRRTADFLTILWVALCPGK